MIICLDFHEHRECVCVMQGHVGASLVLFFFFCKPFENKLFEMILFQRIQGGIREASFLISMLRAFFFSSQLIHITLQNNILSCTLRLVRIWQIFSLLAIFTQLPATSYQSITNLQVKNRQITWQLFHFVKY